MSLQKIRESLKDAYTYLVVPKVMLDTPIAMPKMVKDDGVSYYTINEIDS